MNHHRSHHLSESARRRLALGLSYRPIHGNRSHRRARRRARLLTTAVLLIVWPVLAYIVYRD